MNRSLARFALVAATMAFVAIPAFAQARPIPKIPPELLAQVEGWKTRLNLTDAQKTSVKGLVDQLADKFEPLAEKMEASDRESKRETAKEMMEALQKFQESFQAILTPAQKGEWEKIREESQNLAQDLAATRIAGRMQEKYGLSDDQAKACRPVIAKEVGFLMDAFQQAAQEKQEADGQRGFRRGGLRRLREAKASVDETEAELKKIFTPEQWQKFEADREQKREQMRKKMMESRS